MPNERDGQCQADMPKAWEHVTPWPLLWSGADDGGWEAGMKEQLSKVYFDDKPVVLMGDESRPRLSRIVRAGGKRPDHVDVLVLNSPADMIGQRVAPNEIIDRTAEPTKPIYLRSVPKARDAIVVPGQGGFERAKSGDVVPRILTKPAPDAPRDAPEVKGPMPNLDPVISQLGLEPQRPVDHSGSVFQATHFRSPSQGPAAAAPAPFASLSAQAKRAQLQAEAEAEAERRQEEDRDMANSLQDEQEESDDAHDDESSY